MSNELAILNAGISIGAWLVWGLFVMLIGWMGYIKYNVYCNSQVKYLRHINKLENYLDWIDSVKANKKREKLMYKLRGKGK